MVKMTTLFVKRIKAGIRGRMLMSTIVVIQANVVNTATFIAPASNKNKSPSLAMASQENNANLLMINVHHYCFAILRPRLHGEKNSKLVPLDYPSYPRRANFFYISLKTWRTVYMRGKRLPWLGWSPWLTILCINTLACPARSRRGNHDQLD